jgi:hypothetical protein
MEEDVGKLMSAGQATAATDDVSLQKRQPRGAIIDFLEF